MGRRGRRELLQVVRHAELARDHSDGLSVLFDPRRELPHRAIAARDVADISRRSTRDVERHGVGQQRIVQRCSHDTEAAARGKDDVDRALEMVQLSTSIYRLYL